MGISCNPIASIREVQVDELYSSPSNKRNVIQAIENEDYSTEFVPNTNYNRHTGKDNLLPTVLEIKDEKVIDTTTKKPVVKLTTTQKSILPPISESKQIVGYSYKNGPTRAITHNKLATKRCSTKKVIRNKTENIKHKLTCIVCNKEFIKKTVLNSHMIVHTGWKKFACSICNKAFGHKSHLNRHVKIHTGDKAYSCSLCNKTFITKSHLNYHVNRHTGQRNFFCDICNSGFIIKSSLTLTVRGRGPFFPTV